MKEIKNDLHFCPSYNLLGLPTAIVMERFHLKQKFSVNHVIESCIRRNELLCEIKLAKLIVLVLILFSQFSSSSIFVCLFAGLLVSPVHRGSVTVSVGNPSFFCDRPSARRSAFEQSERFVCCIRRILHSKRFFAGFLSLCVNFTFFGNFMLMMVFFVSLLESFFVCDVFLFNFGCRIH